MRREGIILKNGRDEMEKTKIRITDQWKLPLTRMQIEELDKMVDFYSKQYKR